MEIFLKLCSRCRKEKPKEDFSKDKRSRDKLAHWCRSCYREYARNRKFKISVTEKLCKSCHKILPWNLFPKRSSSKSGLYSFCKLCKSKKATEYKNHNPENSKKVAREWSRHKTKESLNFRISSSLRSRLRKSVIREWKSGSAVDDLGCSIEELKFHLESKFQPGMTWENWGKGKGKWNIDHVIPLSAFDLTDRQHVLLACYYLNLQPLWSEENSRKKNHY